MALPARVTSLDEVDEAFRGEYSEKGGEFVLQVDGIKDHPTVSGLQKAYEAEKRRATERSDKLKEFGDLTPDEVAALRTELDELRESKGGDLISAEDLKELKDRQKDLAARAKRAEELEKELEFRDKDQSTRLKNEIRGALASAGVKKEAVPAAAALIQSEYSARYERGEEGFQPVVTGELNGVPGDHSLAEFVGEFVKGDGAIFLPPTGKGGSGADPTGRAIQDRNGVRQLQMQGTTVRANPDDILSGKAAVVQ